MSNNNIIKCKHCGKIFFNNENEYCPFCGKKLKDYLDFLKDTFGLNK